VHSFRIYLACALFQMGATSDRIMRMLRWANINSLLIYARPNASDTADWLEAAARANIHGARSHTIAAEAQANALQPHAGPPTAAPLPSTTPFSPSAAKPPPCHAPPASARDGKRPAVASTSRTPPAQPKAKPLRKLCPSPKAAAPAVATVYDRPGTALRWMRGAPEPPPRVAPAPPDKWQGPAGPTDDAEVWADALCSAAGVDISSVDVGTVPATDDDDVLANWQLSMPSIERTAASIDDARAGTNSLQSSSFMPGGSDSCNSDSEADEVVNLLGPARPGTVA
jgi:hypothetical protein